MVFDYQDSRLADNAVDASLFVRGGRGSQMHSSRSFEQPAALGHDAIVRKGEARLQKERAFLAVALGEPANELARLRVGEGATDIVLEAVVVVREEVASLQVAAGAHHDEELAPFRTRFVLVFCCRHEFRGASVRILIRHYIQTARRVVRVLAHLHEMLRGRVIPVRVFPDLDRMHVFPIFTDELVRLDAIDECDVTGHERLEGGQSFAEFAVFPQPDLLGVGRRHRDVGESEARVEEELFLDVVAVIETLDC